MPRTVRRLSCVATRNHHGRGVRRTTMYRRSRRGRRCSFQPLRFSSRHGSFGAAIRLTAPLTLDVSEVWPLEALVGLARKCIRTKIQAATSSCLCTAYRSGPDFGNGSRILAWYGLIQQYASSEPCQHKSGAGRARLCNARNRTEPRGLGPP
jgi:hypothetical protein